MNQAAAPQEAHGYRRGGHVAAHEIFDLSNPARYRASRRVTWVSMAVNLLLATGQVVVGVLGHSQALVADGVHTLSDLSTDILVLIALKQGSKAADAEHPYGHGRIETAVTVLLGLALIGVALGIAINAGLRLADPEALPIPSPLALVVAVITILSKEGLYRYTLHTARRYQSKLLRANAWHHRSDAISSVIVLIGIGGSIAGIANLDGIAAVGVAMMIAKIGWELGWDAIKELVDTALDEEEVTEIRNAILAVDGVKTLHLLRTRRTGGQALVDVHIMVDGMISVSEGHHISENVRSRLIRDIESVTDVMVHIDPEDDEITVPSMGLPSRGEFMQRLNDRIAHIDATRMLQRTTLHYLNGKIYVVLHLPLAAAGANAAEREALLARYRAAVRDDPQVGRLDLCYF